MKNGMKNFSILTVALVALTLFSCSKEDSSSAPGEKAIISLFFADKSSTKVATDAVDIDDQVINDASVFVFRASGVIDVARQYLGGFVSDATQDIVATTAAKKVYVVTNIGNEAAHEAMFSTILTEASLMSLVKDRKFDLYSATDAAGETDIRTTDVLMTGSGIVTDFAGTNAAAVDIDLTFPLSKIKLIVKDNRINNKLPAAVTADGDVAIVDEAVTLIYAGKLVKFFSADLGADQAVQSAFYTGWTDGGQVMPYFSDDATSSTVTWLTGNDGTNASTGSTNTAVTHHFYTAANDAATNATVLTIQSEKTVWDNVNHIAVPSKVYYPIHFSMLDAENTLVPGKSYTVTLTLSGDISGGGGTGVVDPLTPVVDGSITATITVAAWDPVGIDKVIN